MMLCSGCFSFESASFSLSLNYCNALLILPAARYFLFEHLILYSTYVVEDLVDID